MIWLYLVSFIILSGGIVLLLGLTPEIVTDDLMGIFVPKQNLRDKILIAQGKKRSRRLTREILHIKDALDATGKAGQFTAACAASVVLMIVGCIFSVMILLHDSGRRGYLRVPAVLLRPEYDQRLR